MVRGWFVVHDALAGSARLPSLTRDAQRMSSAELAVLTASGAIAAAAVGLIKLGLGIPGHSIVLAALPMAFGLSAAPRRLGGSVMSGSALAAGLLLSAAGDVRYGSGAIVSLTLIGPMMDVALRRVSNGPLVYVALMASGVAANLLALASRATTKFLGIDPGGRPFDSWYLLALGTYTASGLVAGLLGALCWFHFSRRSGKSLT
jgi:hypothetical protein